MVCCSEETWPELLQFYQEENTKIPANYSEKLFNVEKINKSGQV